MKASRGISLARLVLMHTRCRFPRSVNENSEALIVTFNKVCNGLVTHLVLLSQSATVVNIYGSSSHYTVCTGFLLLSSSMEYLIWSQIPY